MSASDLSGRCASLDGDADRIVYFTLDPGNTLLIDLIILCLAGRFVLMDGDKMSALIAGFLRDLVQDLPDLAAQLDIGVVQTAYANGNSTRYFEKIVFILF